MTVRLTQREHSALSAVVDWKAVSEVANALYPAGCTTQKRIKIRQELDRLCRRRLVVHEPENNTYKATEAGLALLGAT